MACWMTFFKTSTSLHTKVKSCTCQYSYFDSCRFSLCQNATAHFRSSPTRCPPRSLHRQATLECRDTVPAQFRDCILELGQTPRHWQAAEATEKCFVCRLCGAAMRHRRNLLRHQITVHGRKKNPRGRPPISSY